MKFGDFDIELMEEFFRVVVYVVNIILYVCVLYGSNIYYKIEVLFKVFGRVFREVVEKNVNIIGVNLMKGML